MSLEKIRCPICSNIMTNLKNARLQVEFDTIRPKGHEKMAAFMLVCKKCHNMQTFLDINKGEKEPV